jgi:hypothetical protein
MFLTSAAKAAAKMNTQPKHNGITVYLGSDFEHPQEERFLNRLRRDLSARGVSALIVANFNVHGGSGPRQIDFLVRTDFRLVHVELKTLSEAAPVRGRLNGPWMQDLGGGHSHEINPNPYTQTLAGSYAISDTVGRMAHRGQVPLLDRSFYRDIDKVVSIDPEIPPGSEFDRHQYVAVIGYQELLDRLATKGPRPSWDASHWDAFLRELGVYPAEQDTPSERRRRRGSEALGDYRRRFIAQMGEGLTELVDLGFVGADVGAEGLTFGDVLDQVEDGRSIGLVGASGWGKSHVSRHVAVRASERDALVIWVRCGEYLSGKFSTLLARSAAPFSTDTVGELAGHAGLVDVRRLLVLDGFNECPPTMRQDLAGEVGSFLLRFPSSVLVTSQVDLPSMLADATFVARLPDATQRESIMRAHGSQNPQRVSDAFRSPFELSVAASCEAKLASDATTADLFDAYVRELAPTEVVRAGLRSIALAMIDQLRTSLPISVASSVVGSVAGLGMTPDRCDAVMTSRMLVVTQGGVRFTHELHARFLAAENVVRSSSTGVELAGELGKPSRAELEWFAICLEGDPERRVAALTTLGDRGLWSSAARGDMGYSAAETARAAIRGVLADAAFAVGADELTLEDADGPFFPTWRRGTTWSANENALLGAAGELLSEGMFIEDVGNLLDRTDERLQREADALRAAGSNAPITTVVSSLVGSRSGTTPLGANLVFAAAQMGRLRSKGHCAVAQLLDGAGSRAWSRLMVACEIIGPEDVAREPELLASLVAAAWNANGYHLRIAAMQAVHLCGRSLDEEHRDEMAELLGTFRSDHPFVQSSIVEAYAAIDRLGATLPTVEQLTEMIRSEVLAMDDGPEAWRMAAGVCAQQWEPEDIVGPYYEAVHALGEEDLFRLYIRAAQFEEGYNRGWVLDQLCYFSPTGIAEQDEALRRVFIQATRRPPHPHGIIDDNVDAHVFSARGLGRLGVEFPGDPDAEDETRAWHLVDALITSMESGADVPAACWVAIREELPWLVSEVLFILRYAGSKSSTDHRQDSFVLGRLMRAFGVELRQLFEWEVAHLAEMPDPLRPPFGDTHQGFVIRSLGSLGDGATVEAIRPYLSDPELGRDAVLAIRSLQGDGDR